ncbi:RRM domain containing hypothetical protein [Phytophthora palmivora]|uniref:Cleavage stimulation factor subunit 2 hinge domain-containing protein n=1 Tax=Phytophthora palmivora TaxID=4796 RepID=A0A2P4YE70_9STRA|nr:RRM domain containing hypothetical protein [Phytophthora palmivora]
MRRACAGLDLSWIGSRQSTSVKDLTEAEVYELVYMLKQCNESDPAETRRLLQDHPELARAVAQAQLRLGMIKERTASAPAPANAIVSCGCRSRTASDMTQLQSMEGDLTRARHDVEVAQKAYADRERTITENQAQIRTLSRDLGKVVRERDALRHEYTAAF